MIELYELNSHKMTTPQEKAQCVSWFIHGLLNNRTWTGNGIENRRARVQR